MALYARSGESAEVQVKKVYAARELALASAMGAASSSLATIGDCDALIGAVMQVIGDNHPTARASKLNDRYVAGYGHKSIADCGSTALFVEGGSMLLAKALEDTPLFNGQEMSSRAVDCGAQPFVDPIGTPESAALLESWRAFYKRAIPLAAEETRRRHPRREGEDEAVYVRAVSMRAFDICRGFLPFGCATQVGWTGSLRHVGDRLAVLCDHPSGEVRDVAKGLLEMCRERYPSSGFGDAAVSGTGKLTEEEQARAARRRWSEEMTRAWTYVPESRPLLDGLFFRYFGNHSATSELSNLLESRPRGALLPWSLGSLGQFTYEFPLDMGSWRDIQRQRALLCEPVLLTADHGFEPWYLGELPEPFQDEAKAFVAMQARRVADLTKDAVLRQYYLGMGFRVRTRITATLPALVYMLELRSGKSIHPTLRRRVLEMATELHVAFPEIALHVDRDPDDWSVRRGTHVITDKSAPAAP